MRHTLYNARIVTLSPEGKLERYSWITYDDKTGRTISLGRSNPPRNTVEIDMGLQWIFPGLHDSHLHVTMHGTKQRELNLEKCRSEAEFARDLLSHEIYAKSKSRDKIQVDDKSYCSEI